MKIFLSVFLAILAAGAVFYVFLAHEKKLEQWEAAKQSCIVQLDVTKRAKHELAMGQPESRQAFFSEMEQRHKLEEQIEAVNETLISLLEHKPSIFGSAPTQLSKEDAWLLRFRIMDRESGKSSAELRAAEKRWAESELRAHEFGRLLKLFDNQTR